MTALAEARRAYREQAATEPRLLLAPWVARHVGEDFPAHGTVARSLAVSAA